MNEEKSQICKTIQIPEMQNVMSILNDKIGILNENINNLTLKLFPILIPESPIDVSMDRDKRKSELAENIQKEIDRIETINGLINDLIVRICL